MSVLLVACALAPASAEVPAQAQAPGGLWLVEGEGDEPWLAPQVSSEVFVQVTGAIARARVEQLFDNPSEEAVEAVYVFPVPEGAAVDGLQLQVGQRTLAGVLRERAEAQRAFETAADTGQVATLVSQERPDVFTTRVANIPPGARVSVTLTYHELLRYEHGRLSLVVGSTLTPRYAAATGELGDGAPGGAAASAGAQAAAGLAPPVLLDGSGPLLDVAVELEPGVELASIASPSHELELSRRGGRLAARLRDGPVLADRDFRLSWRPALGAGALAGSVVEDSPGARHALVVLPPPFDALPAPSLAQAGAGDPPAPERAPGASSPRAITFVIDTSRSMAGAPLALASATLRTALMLLRPVDHFDVIAVGSSPEPWFAAPQPASALNVGAAVERLSRLVASGDTALLPALELALKAPSEAGRSERVVLLSDGAVGDEGRLFRQIAAALGARRLFTVGVGSAPARYVLRGAAHTGRGTFTEIGAPGEVALRVRELDAALGAPVLDGVAVAAPEGARARLPAELYAGEALTLLARLAPGAEALTLTAQGAGQAWRRELALGGAAHGPVARLWARRELVALGGASDPAATASQALLALARERSLASALTSFVAVDPVASVEVRAPRAGVPHALPAGSEMFGKPPRPAPQGPTCAAEGRARGALAARAHVQCGLPG